MPDDESSTPEETAEMVILGEVVKTRAEQAYDLKRQGKTLQFIADELGYSSVAEVSTAISSRMELEAQYITVEERQSLLQMENDRLDELQAVYYPSALLGDFKSADMVLRIMAMRQKVNKMDALDTDTNQQTVLIIGGKEEDYVKQLKALDE